MDRPLSVAPAPVSAAASGVGGGSERPAFWLGLLALPFVLCLAFLWATGRRFPVFWENDEMDYWALMQWFAARLPGFSADYPHSATTPLFPWLGAWAVRWIGADLQAVRTLNALVSFAGVCVLFDALRRPFRFRPATAALLTALVAFSAYYFGYSFRLLTDNAALVGCLLAMRELFRAVDAREPAPRRRFLWACLWWMAAILTRQSYAFLGLPLLVGLALMPRPAGGRGPEWLALASALVPLAALVWAWRGLVPAGYQTRHTASLFHPYALSLPLLLLGFYAPWFFAVPVLRSFRGGGVPPVRWVPPLLGALAALAVLCFCPLIPSPGAAGPAYFSAAFREAPATYSGGWIYTVGQHLPAWRANSLWFWLFLPLGTAAAVAFGSAAWRGADPLRRVAAAFLLGLLCVCVSNAVLAQKYYDAPVLLFLIWFSRGDLAGDPRRSLPLCALLALFGLYYVAFPFLAAGKPVLPAVPAPDSLSSFR